jgi:hypothetical protein
MLHSKIGEGKSRGLNKSTALFNVTNVGQTTKMGGKTPQPLSQTFSLRNQTDAMAAAAH